MRRQAPQQSTTKPVFLLALICIPIWALGLQPLNASAYQSDEATSTPVIESTATLPPEEPQPTFTNTPEPTLIAEPTATETATILPSPISLPSVVPENHVPPTSTDSPPLLILSGEYAPDEVLVRFKKSVTDESILECLSSADATVLSSIEELSVLVVQIPFGKVAESIAAISVCPQVRYVEPNYMASIADTIPSDPNWGWQYGLVNIRAPQGWDYSTGSTSVTIAIIDSGIDLSHADLAAKIVPGYDFVNDDFIPQDDNGHGTHAAGIAAAIGNNGVGVAGVSWGARIMPVKVLNAGGGGFFADAADGIIWATDHGARIINLSLGGSSNSKVLQDAVNYAYGKGVLLVAAAGNTGGNFVLYPAHYPNVIAVGAVDSLNNRAWFSNYGLELDLVAPGVNIYSTVIGGYDYNSGTSMAAPYVSGLAAILYGISGNGSSALVISQMEFTALDLGAAGFDAYHGFGLIQMDSALKLVLPPTATPTQSFVAANGGRLFSNPGVPTFAVMATSMNTPTASPTATSATLTPLPATTQPADSVTPAELQALSIQKEPITRVRNLPAWQLPCAGLAFLLAGLLLLWAARRKR